MRLPDSIHRQYVVLARNRASAYVANMLTYRDLTTQERRALDRFARSSELEAPASRWAELGPAAIAALVKFHLLEGRGPNADGEEIYRLTDEGTRVHDEMWRDGKVPSHPDTDPFDPTTLEG